MEFSLFISEHNTTYANAPSCNSECLNSMVTMAGHFPEKNMEAPYSTYNQTQGCCCIVQTVLPSLCPLSCIPLYICLSDSVYDPRPSIDGMCVHEKAGYAWTPASSPNHYVFKIRYNYLHHYGLGILNDFGGVYVSADNACWQSPSTDPQRPSCNMATLVQQNVIHDAECFNYGGDGIYTDANAEGVDVASNLVYDVNAAGLSFHCGVNLTATNNYIISADYAGNRGVLSACNMGGFTRPLPIHVTFLHNIFYLIDSKSHYITPHTRLANSSFNYNLYFDASHAIIFPNGTNFKQWQAAGQVSLSLKVICQC